MDSPHICCEPDSGNFCQIQCNNGFCRCVDPSTGEPTTDFTFPENDESISCDLSEYAIVKHACSLTPCRLPDFSIVSCPDSLSHAEKESGHETNFSMLCYYYGIDHEKLGIIIIL